MLDVIKNRRSVRKFDLSKKVSYDTLVELCKYASYAPTARNQEDREYMIIDDEKIINELSEVSKGSQILKNCNTVIAILGKSIMEASVPEMVPSDLAAATENLLLAATSLKLGSCWVGIYPMDMRMIKCNQILGLNNGVFVFSLIAIGYPEDDDVFYEKDKFKLGDLHHNKY